MDLESVCWKQGTLKRLRMGFSQSREWNRGPKIEGFVEGREVETLWLSTHMEDFLGGVTGVYCVELNSLNKHCTELNSLNKYCVELNSLNKHCVELNSLNKHCVELISLNKHCVELISLNKHCVELNS